MHEEWKWGNAVNYFLFKINLKLKPSFNWKQYILIFLGSVSIDNKLLSHLVDFGCRWDEAADKAYINQQKRKQVVYSFIAVMFYKKYLENFEIKCKTGMYFLFNFGCFYPAWYSS